jgi:hypothetical protein
MAPIPRVGKQERNQSLYGGLYQESRKENDEHRRDFGNRQDGARESAPFRFFSSHIHNVCLTGLQARYNLLHHYSLLIPEANYTTL